MEKSAWRTDKEIATTNEDAKKWKKKKKNTGIWLDEKAKIKQQTSLTMQLKGINQKILSKERRVQR